MSWGRPGLVALGEHDRVTATLHHVARDGPSGEQDVHRDGPALSDQPWQYLGEDRHRMRLARHCRLPQGQPQPLVESREEMDRGGSWLAPAAPRFPIDGQDFHLIWSRGQRRQDAGRPGAQCVCHQGPVQLAHDVRQGRGTGCLGLDNTQGPRQLLAITAAPVGYRTGTPVATRQSDAHQGQHGRQGMPSPPWIAGRRNVVEASHEGTDWGFH